MPSTHANQVPSITHQDYAIYDFQLNFLHGGCGDILAKLRATRTYIVDNNISWKPLAAAFPTANFLLGCTLTEEAENLEGVLFSGMPVGGYPNVYTADMAPSRKPLIVLHRLSDTLKSIHARAIPPLSTTSQGHAADQKLAAHSFRRQVVRALAIHDQATLEAKVLAALGSCRGSYFRSGMTAVLVTALYLAGCSKAQRDKKLKSDYIQFPGDSRLIAEAIMFGFRILSEDRRDVHTMAKLANVVAQTSADLKRAMNS